MMPTGPPPIDVGYSPRSFPVVVIRPILLAEYSVNQRFPSEPATIRFGPRPSGGSDLGRSNSLISPLTVIRPILLALYSVNQRLWSGPTVIPTAPQSDVGMEYSVILP